MAKKEKRYTPGMEDIERTFDSLEEQRKKEATAAYLKEREERRHPKPKTNNAKGGEKE